MGYFSNGTMGEMYETRYCERCIHYSELPGCPVFVLHLVWNYDQHSDPTKAEALEQFIPTLDAPPWNGPCKMFVAKEGKP
jgi:hypothetical protein